MTTPPGRPVSALAPLRIGLFRALWLAGVVSNIGSWMQTVGAQWLLVESHSSAAVIALVQTAAAVPVLLLGIPAGVIGEFVNRRHLLIGVQAFQVAVALALTVLTSAGAMTPPLLLTLTFLIGAASALQLPAYQALVPEIVPAPLISNAAALSSIGVNIARALGPALAGLVIARAGIPAVFAIDAATFAVFMIVLLAWRGYTPPVQRREPFIDATRAGLRYIRNAGLVRRIYLQLALFMIPANALWALLPVVASSHLGLDSNGYGLLLTALGLGSITGAFVIPAARSRLGTNTVVLTASTTYGIGIAVTAMSANLAVVIPVLVLVGVGWIGVVASLNGTVQAFLPVWVRARGLSIYQLVLFGSTAIGSALSGLAAGIFGATSVVVGAGGLVVLAAAALLLWPLTSTAGKDRTISPPLLADAERLIETETIDGAAAVETHPGPALVLVRYSIPAGPARSSSNTCRT